MYVSAYIQAYKFNYALDEKVGIRNDVSSKQSSSQARKKTDFTVYLIWWGSLRLTPNNELYNLYRGFKIHPYFVFLPTTSPTSARRVGSQQRISTHYHRSVVPIKIYLLHHG